MSTDPIAKLFYGYIQEAPEEGEWSEKDEETSWDRTYGRQPQCGCTVDVYGYSGSLGYFLAIEESLHTAEWSEIQPIDLVGLGVKRLESTWDMQLRQAAEIFGLDLTGLKPGWYLVCLYF